MRNGKLQSSHPRKNVLIPGPSRLVRNFSHGEFRQGASAIAAGRDRRLRRGWRRVLPDFAKRLECARLAGDFGQTLPVRKREQAPACGAVAPSARRRPALHTLREDRICTLMGMGEFHKADLPSLVQRILHAAYLLPGLTAGRAARSGGSRSGAKVSTWSEIRLCIGTPNCTVPSERSTAMAMPTTWPPWARTMSRVS